MKTKTLADFQICISLPLTELKQQLKIEVAEALKNELKKGKSYSQQFRYFNNILRFVRSKQMKSLNSMVEGYVQEFMVFQPLIMKLRTKCLIR